MLNMQMANEIFARNDSSSKYQTDIVEHCRVSVTELAAGYRRCYTRY